MNAISRHWEVARIALAEDKKRTQWLMQSSDVDFLPAALEIVDKPVSPGGRIAAYLLASTFIVTLLWLTFGEIDVVASAPGKLIPADNVKLVQPAEAGIVRAIMVRDGQYVRKGQPLVALDPTVSTAEAAQASKALRTAELDAARARAILSALDGHGLAFRAPEGTPATLADTQRQLAAAELGDIQSGIAAYEADRRSAAAARSEARNQAVKLDETLPLLDEQLSANEQLLAKGYVSKLKVIEMRRQRMAAARDRDISLDTASKAEAQMARAGSSAAQSRAQARARILDQLSKAEAEGDLRREELTKATQRSSLQKLRSPVDGTVAQLAVHTIGGVVEPAKPIMVIVPKGGALVAEVKLANRDMGFVKVGQPVAVKLEAFPFTRYGAVPGHVEWMSADAVEDEKAAAVKPADQGLVFTLRVSLDRLSIPSNGSRVPLSSGMSVTADIRTGKRTIMSYLLSPIDEARFQAARER
jgi:hemolysin D